MESLNFAQEYEQALLQAYPYALYFGQLFSTPNNGRYEWLNADTIQVPTIKTTGRVDGDMDTIGQTARNFTYSWTPLKVTRHRVWRNKIHPRQVQLSNRSATIENITRVFNEEQKFPEMDAYLISKLHADFLAAGKVADNTALTTDNILSVIDKWMIDMDNDRVPRSSRVLYATPDAKNLIENAKDIYRSIQVDRNTGRVNRSVTWLDDLRIEDSVPKDMMKTVYDFTDGWAVDSTAKQINMMLVDPMAVITPVHYEFAQLDPPAAGTDGNYLYFEESFEDVFLLPKRDTAIKFNVDK